MRVRDRDPDFVTSLFRESNYMLIKVLAFAKQKKKHDQTNPALGSTEFVEPKDRRPGSQFCPIGFTAKRNDSHPLARPFDGLSKTELRRRRRQPWQRQGAV